MKTGYFQNMLMSISVKLKRNTDDSPPVPALRHSVTVPVCFLLINYFLHFGGEELLIG